MDFTPVLRNAWLVTRGHASWWLMAIVANSLVAGFSLPSFGGSPQPIQPRRGAPPLPSMDVLLATWWAGWSRLLAGHIPLVAGAAGIAFALLLLLWAWSVRAQGALSWGTLRLARGEVVRRADAWRLGGRLFWRFAALSVIGLVLGWLALALALGGAYAALRPATAGGAYRAYLNAVSSPWLGLWTLVLVPSYIIIAFAKRAMALQDLAVGAALRSGWQTLRRRPGASLLAWVINVAFYFVGLLLVAVVVFVVGGALSLLAVVLAAIVAHALPSGAHGLSAGLWPYVGTAATLAMLLMFLCLGGLNVFLSSFWSEVYVRLSLPQYDPESIAIG